MARIERLPLAYAYGFGQYPAPLKGQLQSRDVLARNLATSQTVAEFTKKTLNATLLYELFGLPAKLNAASQRYFSLPVRP